MKTKVKRFSKRTLAVILGVVMLISCIGLGSLITASADTVFYYDFTKITGKGGVNYYNNSDLRYDSNGKGKVFKGALPSNSNTVIAKTEEGGWSDVKVSNVTSGYDTIVFNSDGKTYTFKNQAHYRLWFKSGTTAKDGSTSLTSGFHAYAWGGNGGGDGWPGTDISSNSIEIQGDTYYYFEYLEYNGFTSVILNDGNSGNKHQTDDITISNSLDYTAHDDSGYYWDGDSWEELPSPAVPLATPTVSISPNPVTAGGTSGVLTITCSDSSKVDHYDLYVDGTDSGTDIAGTTHTIGNSYSLNGKKYSVVAIPKAAETGYTASEESDPVTLTVNKTTLTAPSITAKNGDAAATTSNITTSAVEGGKVKLAWSAVTNAGSYDVYKGSSKVATGVTNLYYNVEKGYSYGGAYTVKAVPSNTDVYNTSAASNSITLTFNKVKLSAPTVTVNPAEVNAGSTATFTLTDTNTSYTAGTDFKYQRTASGDSSYSNDVSNLSYTTGALSTAGNNTYKFRATALKTDYFSNSDATSQSVYVSKASMYIVGDIVGSWNNSTTYPVNTYVKKNVYSWTKRVTNKSADGKSYFRIYNGTNQYTVTSGVDTDMSTHNSEATEVTANTSGTSGSMYVTGNGVFTIYVDNTTSTSPKVWVVCDGWPVDAEPYYQSYNLASDTYDSAASGTTGGTVDQTSATVAKGNSITLTATPASGYTFDGWYPNTSFTVGERLSTNAAYTFTPSDYTKVYPLFKKTAPARRTVTVSSVANATLTATYKGVTHAEGESFEVPSGASVTFAATADTGYRVSSSSPATGSHTVSSDTTFTATIVKTYTVTYHKYGPCDPSSVTLNGTTLTQAQREGTYTATIDEGAAVNMTANAGTNNKFMGWYLSSDCSRNVVSTNTTATVYASLDRNIDVYGFFGYDKYWLGGYLRKSNYGDSTNFNRDGSMEMTVNDASKPWLYTISYDKVGAQYALVTMVGDNMVGDKMYNTAGTSPSDVKSGAVSGGSAINYDSGTSNKWYESSASYNTITYTWNAITTRLSWELSTIDYSNKTVLLLDTDRTHEYIWSYGSGSDHQIGNDYPGAAISSFPEVTIDGTTYRMVVLNNSDFASGDTKFTVKLSNNQGNAQQIGEMEKGKYNVVHCTGSSITKDTPIAMPTHTITVTDTGTVGTETTAAPTADASAQLKGLPVTVTTHPDSTHSAVVTVTDSSSNTVPVEQNGKKFTFTMPDKNVTVNVSYIERDPTARKVTVYANLGGSVDVTYGGASETIAAGENATFKIAEEDTINLTATPAGTNVFHSWTKNLNDEYSTSATLNDEVITTNTVYVASFATAGGGGGDHGDVVANARVLYGTGNDISSVSTTDVYLKDGTYYANLSEDTAFLTALNGASNGNFFLAITTDGTGNTADARGANLLASSSGVNTNLSGNLASSYGKDDNGQENHFGTQTKKKFPRIYKRTSNTVEGFTISASTTNNTATYNLTISNEAIVEGGGEPLGGYTPIVNYYAKDSAFAGDSKNSYFTTDTVVTPVSDSVTVSSGTNYNYGNALKGSEFTVTTTISGTITQANDSSVNAKDKYYVAGFSFNGYTPEILEPNDTGVYTCTYTLPEKTDAELLEVTPIYFLKDDTYTATVYFNGYEELKSKGWGNTLYVYPFYRYYLSGSSGTKTKYNGQAENFAGYPGQPVINNRGQLYTQIPLTNDGTAGGWDSSVTNVIKGITLSNGYSDNMHKSCATLTTEKQTYDYDDFQKIQKEKADGLHSIYFSFKYKEEDSAKQHRLSSKTSSYSSYSRCNDMMESSRFNSATVNQEVLESGTAINEYTLPTADWEDLTDALGNKVDIFGNAVKDATATPLRVISMGYEFNNSGRYATEWAVYYWDSTASKYKLVEDTSHTIDSTNADTAHNSSIVPSALIMNSSSNFSNYTAMDGDLGISGYSKLYEKLQDYAGLPVKIDYEYEATYSAHGRCDGRWNYTSDKDFVQSNIKLEYKAKNSDVYVEDTLSASGVGSTTGAKAYFTNDEYYGKIISDSELISNTDYYTFTAEDSGSYEFAGWYLRDTNGKESVISEKDYSTKTLKSGNHTLIARFDYVESGNLTISNSVANGQEGRATTYLGVTAIFGGQETVLANVNSNTAPVKIGKDIIKSNSGYTLKIDVRTVPTGENNFASYACYTTDGSGESDVRSASSNNNIYNSSNSSHTSDTYTVTVSSDLYSSGDQIVKAIEYVSTLTPVNYTYKVQYNYTSRQYGSKTYTKTGTLNAAQIANTNIVTGTEGQNNKKLTSAFLASIAPHESNFNSKITWNTDAGASDSSSTYNSGTNTYAITATVNSSTPDTSEATKTVYFSVPYAQTSSNSGVASTITESGTLIEYANKTDNTTFSRTATFENFVYSSGTTFVTAPSQIRYTEDGNNVTKYFQYWQISTVAGSRGASRPVGRCYYNEFNYRIYDNYNVTPVYGDDANYASLYAENEGTAISYLGSTRNQWNDNNGVNDYDLIYNDFMVTFKPLGHATFNSYAGAKAGVIIQKLKEVELNASGKNAKSLADYEKDYSAADLTAAKTAVENKLNGLSYDKSAYPMATRTIDTSLINNKNHYLFTYARYDKQAGEPKDQSPYLYRAYSYMKYNGGSYIVSDEPAYFCMYDIAND